LCWRQDIRFIFFFFFFFFDVSTFSTYRPLSDGEGVSVRRSSTDMWRGRRNVAMADDSPLSLFISSRSRGRRWCFQAHCKCDILFQSNEDGAGLSATKSAHGGMKGNLNPRYSHMQKRGALSGRESVWLE
jgi:hypothetical protein